MSDNNDNDERDGNTPTLFDAMAADIHAFALGVIGAPLPDNLDDSMRLGFMLGISTIAGMCDAAKLTLSTGSTMHAASIMASVMKHAYVSAEQWGLDNIVDMENMELPDIDKPKH